MIVKPYTLSFDFLQLKLFQLNAVYNMGFSVCFRLWYRDRQTLRRRGNRLADFLRLGIFELLFLLLAVNNTLFLLCQTAVIHSAVFQHLVFPVLRLIWR